MKIDARTIDTGAHAYIPPWSRTSAVASGGFLLGRGGATCTGFTDPISGTLACSSFAILSSKAARSFDNWPLSGDCVTSRVMIARPCQYLSSARSTSPCLANTLATRPWLIARSRCRSAFSGSTLAKRSATARAVLVRFQGLGEIALRHQDVADLAVRRRDRAASRHFRVDLGQAVGNRQSVPVRFQGLGESALRHQEVANLDVRGEIPLPAGDSGVDNITLSVRLLELRSRLG